MADTSYSYVIVDDFTYDVADPEQFELEIANSSPAIASAVFIGTQCNGDPQSPSAGTTLKVWFDDPLSGGDETQLDVLVAAHDGRVQTKDINSADAALATTDKLILQKSDDLTDEAIAFSKDVSGNMLFQDDIQTTPVSLTTLLGGGGLTEATHKALRQLIHFIDDGPAEGFTSGAYREVTGTVFPTSIIWWESSSKLKKILERTITWSGATITTDVWEMYDTDGSTVLVTVSDSISYSGVFETSRTRTIS